MATESIVENNTQPQNAVVCRIAAFCDEHKSHQLELHEVCIEDGYFSYVYECRSCDIQKPMGALYNQGALLSNNVKKHNTTQVVVLNEHTEVILTDYGVIRYPKAVRYQ